MAWIRCEVEPCTPGNLFREHHLAVVFLREPLQPTGNVDGIPHRCEIGRLGIAHVPDDGWPGVEPNAHFEWVWKFSCEGLREFSQTADHGTGRQQGTSAPFRRALAHPKEGHHAIARKLIGNAASVFNRAANRFKVAVQEEDDIVGQFWFGQPSETAQISEQHGNLLLLSSMMPRHGKASTRLGVGRQERYHCHIVRGAQLTGQAHVGRRPDPVKDTVFFHTGWRDGGSALYDTHPAR